MSAGGPGTLLGHHRRMHAYDAWAGALVGRTLVQARERLEGGTGGGSASAPALVKGVRIYSHTQVVRRLWLARLGGCAPADLDGGLFPGWALERGLHEDAELSERWSAYLSGLDEGALAGVAEYVSTEGDRYRTPVADVLTHVPNHSHYHRGQIARLVAECGVSPAGSDFVHFARTPAARA